MTMQQQQRPTRARRGAHAPPRGSGFIAPSTQEDAYALAEQQAAVAWLAQETAADLAATLALHVETAATVAHTTGTLIDRLEVAMHFAAGAPGEVVARARVLWRELQVLHGLLVQSLDPMLRREAETYARRGAGLGGRLDVADYYATAIGGALIGLRHFEAHRGVHATTYVRTWVRKALTELAENAVGPLTATESGIRAARAVRRGDLAPSSPRGQQVRALVVGGSGYVREQIVDEHAERAQRPDTAMEEREREVETLALRHTLSELADEDPVAAQAVRRAFGLDAGRPGRPVCSEDLERGLAWLREVYQSRAKAVEEPSRGAARAAKRRAARSARTSSGDGSRGLLALPPSGAAKGLTDEDPEDDYAFLPG